MSMWNLLMDINLASQGPINFTERSFTQRSSRMLDIFFAQLEVALHPNNICQLLDRYFGHENELFALAKLNTFLGDVRTLIEISNH